MVSPFIRIKKPNVNWQSAASFNSRCRGSDFSGFAEEMAGAAAIVATVAYVRDELVKVIRLSRL